MYEEFLSTNLSRWKVSAELGTVNADINAAASAGQTLTGPSRAGPGPGRAILFNVVGATGGGDLLFEFSSNGTSWYTLRPTPIFTGGVPAGTDAYVYGSGAPSGSIVFYRSVFVAKGASASVVVTSQICIP